MVFGTSARSTMVRLRLVFRVHQCASYVFADGTGRDERRSRVVSTNGSSRAFENTTCIITCWCLAHARMRINYKTHSRVDRNSNRRDNSILEWPARC